MSQPQPPALPPPIISFWMGVGRMFAKLLATRAHADLVITVVDGHVKLVRVDQRYLPTDLPQG